ncbi:hypothetical protein V2J09_021407 [Rumex salicifolius]
MTCRVLNLKRDLEQPQLALKEVNRRATRSQAKEVSKLLEEAHLEAKITRPRTRQAEANAAHQDAHAMELEEPRHLTRSQAKKLLHGLTNFMTTPKDDLGVGDHVGMTRHRGNPALHPRCARRRTCATTILSCDVL